MRWSSDGVDIYLKSVCFITLFMVFEKKLLSDTYVRIQMTFPKEVAEHLKRKHNMSSYTSNLIMIDMQNTEPAKCDVCGKGYIRSIGCETCRTNTIKRNMGCEV